MCCGYSEEFRQVVSCTEGSVSKELSTEERVKCVLTREHDFDSHQSVSSKCYRFQVVKVWDFDTGRQVFEFGGTHDLSVITCMTFDLKGRR